VQQVPRAFKGLREIQVAVGPQGPAGANGILSFFRFKCGQYSIIGMVSSWVTNSSNIYNSGSNIMLGGTSKHCFK